MWDLVCNGTARIKTLCLVLVLLGGCQKDEKPVEESKESKAAAQAVDTKKKQAMSIPVTPIELFKPLPDALPKGLHAGPGSSVEALKKARPNLQASPYSNHWLLEYPKDGPFRVVQYQLSRDRKRVAAVLGIFREGYDTQERREALVESIDVRIGKGTKFKDARYEGHRWRQIDQRIDLRTDLKDKALELVLHQRGKVDPLAPRP